MSWGEEGEEGLGWGGGGPVCATGHNGSPSRLTSMCHLAVLQISLHMLPGVVRTYIVTAGWNLHRCTCGHFNYLFMYLGIFRVQPRLFKDTIINLGDVLCVFISIFVLFV